MSKKKSFTLLFGSILYFLNCFFVFCSFSNLHAFAAEEAQKPYIVVLDAGHGGKDSGASIKIAKKRSVLEKDLALGIAIRTKRILLSEDFQRLVDRPLKVLMTRAKDESISLEDRSILAKNQKADLFVSIHLNSNRSKSVRGLETYFLDNTGAATRKKLEQIENKHSKRYAKDKPESLLLRSIMTDAVVETSKTAATQIHSSILSELDGHYPSLLDRQVHQGLFYVLLDAQVPSILLEAFYLTNQDDLEFVQNAENRHKIALGLSKGIMRFLVSK
ncbi:MAG: N-acetylmuramoyl-L-alanine amidase [Oligoflexia bacterium]|nr:N-acetylmuramoyl-L-alanine amidase [Oligoflexia bacterium]